MTVYMADPTGNGWGEGITDELEPFQSKWSDTGQLMFGFKTKGGALLFVIGPDGKLAYRDNDEKRFYRLSKGDNSRFASLLPTQDAREGPQSQTVPSKCELIAQREAETRQKCSSGNFNACREIAGSVANKVMEGCSSATSSTAKQVEEDSGQAASQNAQSQSSSVDAEQYMVEEATIDITSRNMSPPKYPPAAFRAGIQGEVGLVVDVDANGNVMNVAVEKSSRNRDLDRAAMEAARKWRFNAAKSSSGAPMAGRIRVPVTFALDGGESSNGVPEESTSSIGFKSIRDAIAELWAHSDYANLRETDFSRIDVARGIAEVDASTQMYLPPGSTDMLVTYYEGNSGLHELIAYRYDGNEWRDISREVLPGYQADASRFRGTNYYLDSAGDTVKVRSLPAKKAWRYSGGRFVQEG